ncbi:MAG TPA: toprim domain-containing protein, partial [Mesotoga sp.]|nr:toprim domain-containing protein [Mesotoga sp.]
VTGLLGTALTEGHLRILGNYTKNLLFFLDSDSAGQTASLRSIDLAERMDFSTAVAMVKGAKDPAELFVLKGSQGVNDALSMSIPGSIFRVEFYSRKLDLSLPQAKKHLIEYLKPYVESFSSSGNLSAREMTFRALSEKTGFSEDELVRFTKKESRELDRLDHRTTITLRNKDILRVYLQYPPLRSRAARQLELLEPKKEFRELLRGMKKGLELEELLDLVDGEFGRELIELASSCIDQGTALRIIDSTGEYMNRRLVEEQIAEIDRRLSTLEDEEAKAALLIRRIELRRLLDKRKRGGD